MERRRKNSPRLYSVMKRRLQMIVAALVCLCVSIPLSAQKVTATYDYAKQTLVIDNKSGHVAYLHQADNENGCLQTAIQKYLQEKGDSTADDYITIGTGESKCLEVDSSEVGELDTLTVRLLVPEVKNKSKKIVKVPVLMQNQSVGEMVVQQPGTPFYVKWLSETKNILYGVAGALTVLILLVVLVLILRRKKRGEAGDKESPHVMQVVEEEKNDYVVGLDYVRQNSGQYFAVDVEEFVSDTAVKKVYFSREAVKSLNSYYKSFLEQPERTNETGCYLIGGWENVGGNEEQYNISVEEMVVPGDDAVYEEYSLNFGLKIGIKLGNAIRNLSEKTGRDYVHTVWMHSHPGLGLFLSSHDLVVQKQLAYPDAPKRMVAIVIDTNTPNWQMAFFTAKNNGGMNNKDDLLKTISFDVLNEWSRHRAAAVQNTATVDNSFIVTTEDIRDEFAFSAKCINQIDDAVYADAPVACSPLWGEIRQNGELRTRVVSACDSSGDDREIGWLVIDTDTDEAFDAHRCEEKLAQADFCLVYRSEQECYLVWLNADRKIRFVHTSLKEMKEWTRRRRI